MMQKTGFEKRRYQPGFYHNSPTSLNTSKDPKETGPRRIKKSRTTMTELAVIPDKAVEVPACQKETRLVRVPDAIPQVNSFTQKLKNSEHSSFSRRQLIRSGVEHKIEKISPAQNLERKIKAKVKKKSSVGGDILAELLVTIVFTLVYYLIALCLMTLFPAMSEAVALALSVVIIIVGIIVLAIIYSPKK